MNATEKILALFSSLLFLTSQKAPVTFKACRDNSPFADPLEVSLSPNPLLVKKGAIARVHVNAQLLQTIQPGFKVKLKVEVRRLFMWLTVPCLKVSIRIS